MNQESSPFGPCPGCGAALTVHYTVPDYQPRAVGHPVPACRSFEIVGADDFVRWVMDQRDAARRRE